MSHIKFGGVASLVFELIFFIFPFKPWTIVHEGQKIQSNSVGSNSYLSNHQSRLLFMGGCRILKQPGQKLRGGV